MAHLPHNKKLRLTVEVLDGMSMAEAGRLLGVPATTAKDIFYRYALTCFLSSEIGKFNLTTDSKRAEYQRAWLNK